MNGKRFAEIRKELGMTQQQIADRLHTNRVTVANWERDKYGIPGYVPLALAALLANLEPVE